MRDNKLQVLLFVSLLFVTGCGATTPTPPSTKSLSVGIITEFRIPTPDSNATAIAAGPDGNLWFTEINKVGRITPRGAITEFPVSLGHFLSSITAGPDGNLWFTDNILIGSEGTYDSKIGRITPQGAITEFPTPTPHSDPGSITRGPDGNLWFTEQPAIGRITLQGAITEFPIAASQSGSGGITTGPDGNLWLTEHN